MTFSRAIETALEAAESAILLNSGAQIARAAKAWRRSPVLGIDTEFVRERTFYANLGLVQLSDAHTVWLVDPLVDGATEPLRAMLEDPSILKIVHSPSEDLEVLLHAVGAVPEPMIDTQVACAMLGKPLQLGYHAAADWLLDVNIDKDQTRSNWCKRPLRQAQLRYAALDVCLLPLMWEKLQEELAAKDRLDWVQEDSQKQLIKARSINDDGDYWQRIRGHQHLDGQGLAILQALAEWRESEARSRNRPRGFVIPDPVLLNIARNKLSSVSSLDHIDGLHPRTIERHAEAVMDKVNQVISSGHRLETIESMTPAERKQLAKMKQLVQDKASKLGIEAAVLASKRDLTELVENGRDQWPEKLQGWRRIEIGADLERVLE